MYNLTEVRDQKPEARVGVRGSRIEVSEVEHRASNIASNQGVFILGNVNLDDLRLSEYTLQKLNLIEELRKGHQEAL